MLSWMPNVQAGGKPVLTLPFYTSDLPGEYTVTVEGITKEGKAIRVCVFASAFRNRGVRVCGLLTDLRGRPHKNNYYQVLI
ncbi:hypothetical protein [uncultured Parabacteroides sp.]|uniref:hypothetical protein n=1 Tax=uncultured Parabacteroides sp. TaxID=512312 RepID=UPI002632BE53|nr:hypothetical protein [uncultured Parabacteroides sp.]